MSLHPNITGVNIHVIHAFTYVNATARTTATGLLSTDIGKVALQLSDNSFWALVNNSPVTWVGLSGGGGGSGVSNEDFLLESDIPSPDTTYSNTIVSGLVSQELWIRTSDSSNIKTIDYTYTGPNVTGEVRKIYASDGTTIIAQLTLTYIYSGSSVSSITAVRNI